MRVAQRETGAALLAVLLLVAVMSALAVASLERLQLATRLAGNIAALDQARAFATAAEALAVVRINDLIAQNPEKTTLAGGWQGERRTLPLPDGGVAFAQVWDGGNCFNLNSVAEGSDPRALRTRYLGVEQFVALMAVLDIPEGDARSIGGALADWIEADGLHDLMAVAPLPWESTPVELREGATPAAAARPVSRGLADRVGRAMTTGSFSAWASGIEADVRHDDAGVLNEADDDTPEAGIFAFAAGARAGTCLHEVLQFADFRDPDALRDPESEASGRVARTLRLHGLHVGRAHRAPLDKPERAVCEMVARVASAEVPGFGFALKDVAADRDIRDTEWQFHAPRSSASPSAIADVFHAHGDDALRAYAPALRRLSSAAAEDLFIGIADLVVQHPARTDDAPGGPFYLFDWKSNHLGPTAAHYGTDAVCRAMRGHHYFLQAHLYAVGLHRHLRTRLGDAYDPEAHLGGVAYVFLRGVAEGAETGFWTARPSRALVDSLDALLFSNA